jgi:rhomboid family GlyGly-CTERM serine protease
MQWRKTEPGRHNGLWPVAAVLVAVALALALMGAPATQALRYERHAVLAGQVWRLISAHLVHLGWVHAALNAVALAGIAWLLGPLHTSRRWAGLALVCALGVSLGLWAFSPRIDWYVGLSGVIHGLAAAGAATLLRQDRTGGRLWLAALAVKLAWEQWQGPASGSLPWLAGATIVDAHLYGAVAGLAGSLALARRDPPSPSS